MSKENNQENCSNEMRTNPFSKFENLTKERWQRQEGERPLLRQIYVSCEGVVTEPEYFEKLRPFILDDCRLILIKRDIKEVGHSSPPHVKRKIDDYRRVRHIKLATQDEQWLVFDVDSWTPEQFEETFRWAASRKNNFLGISNPDFEYWLLLHFEDPIDKLSPEGVDAQLHYYLPGYDKHMPEGELQADMLKAAIKRAKKRHWLEIGKKIPPKIARSAKAYKYTDRWEELCQQAERYEYEKPEEMAEASFPKGNGSTFYILVEHLVGENPSRDTRRSAPALARRDPYKHVSFLENDR